MRCLFLALCFFLFRMLTSAQALIQFDYPMIDNFMSFVRDNYEIDLIRKNKVESFQGHNFIFYFDSIGRVIKYESVYDSVNTINLYRYDEKGDRVYSEMSSSKNSQPYITTNHKTYKNGLLVRDSSSSSYQCKHIDYYSNGNLKQELWYSKYYELDHRLVRAFWFGWDSLGRMNRIIERDFMGSTDSVGKLISNRTIFYNEKDQMIGEEEAVKREPRNIKTFECPNYGSASYLYDNSRRLIEIVRIDGPSQKIKYFDNGLISEIESMGKICNDTPFHFHSKYTYTYRK